MKSIQNGMAEGRASIMDDEANNLCLNTIFGRILALMDELTQMFLSGFHTKNIKTNVVNESRTFSVCQSIPYVGYIH